VPSPNGYGPVLPTLLAPLAGLGAWMLPAARVLALAWTALAAFAVYRLLRPAAGPLAGLVAAALSLAALDVSFWTMLVRPDGLMIALWLLAAVPLLPARLAAGADHLDWVRVAAGTALLLAAALTKPTAVVHGAPLVLAWLFVDRRSAARLILALTLAGAAVLLVMQWATDGGFLWVNRIWSLHGTQPGLRAVILRYSAAHMWPYAGLAALAFAVAIRRWRDALLDGSVLLVAGAALVVTLLSKYGASWNSLVPLVPALSVVTFRWWSLAPFAASPGGRVAGTAAAALAAVALCATRTFPLPTATDERNAAALYGFVKHHTRLMGGPILAMRPEMAYFVVNQPVETEGSSFAALARRRAEGTEKILHRLQRGEYTLLVQLHDLPDTGGFAEAIAANYVHAGGCNIHYYFGWTSVHLLARRDSPFYMTPPPGTYCGGPAR
jgi:hypothetical protein